MQLDFHAVSHQGCVRTNNEDSVLAHAPLFVVADGVGGAAAGEVASAILVEQFSQLLPGPVSDADISDALREAHRRIRAHNEQRGVNAATTAAGAAALQLAGGQAYWLFFNIGDSRIYRRVGPAGHPLVQVSVDHSRIQELLEEGAIHLQEAAHHPERNVVTRAVGAEDDLVPDFWLLPMHPGERVMVCSDGLLNDSPYEVVKDIVKHVGGAASAARQLVDLALHGGARDNVSVVVVDVVAPVVEVDRSVVEVDRSAPMAQTVLTARRD